eukprot:1154081-Pelagomonas_calceolata.AAC.18
MARIYACLRNTRALRMLRSLYGEGTSSQSGEVLTLVAKCCCAGWLKQGGMQQGSREGELELQLTPLTQERRLTCSPDLACKRPSQACVLVSACWDFKPSPEGPSQT